MTPRKYRAESTSKRRASHAAELLRALRVIANCDSAPVRQSLFAEVTKAKLGARITVKLYSLLGQDSFAATLLVSMYGLKSWLTLSVPRNSNVDIFGVAGFINASRKLKEVSEDLGEASIGEFSTGLSNLLSVETLRRLLLLLTQCTVLFRILKVVHRINTRYDFLVTCRSASLIACYVIFKQSLNEYQPKAVLVASDSNPEEVSMIFAARRLGIPSIFCSHAFPTYVAPRLHFDLSVLYGPAALEVYAAKGPVYGDVVFSGIEGATQPLHLDPLNGESLTIGIFAPKAVEWDVFEQNLKDCFGHLNASKVLIRWHPNMVVNRPMLERLFQEVGDVVETDAADSFAQVAEHCDLIIGDENSNVHLESLKLGIPSVAVAGISIIPEGKEDQYGFIRNGIIPDRFKQLADLDTDALIAFYSNQEWSSCFQHYDSSYARDRSEVDAEVKTAIFGACNIN